MSNFPQLDKSTIVELKKSIDNAFRNFAGSWGESLTDILSPLHWFLIYTEKLLLFTPWYIFLLILGVIVYFISQNIKLVVASILSFAMALRYSLNLDKEAVLLDTAVQQVLDDGLRTKDIMSNGKKEVSTTDMGDAIISKLK